jgi:hypothetical protein
MVEGRGRRTSGVKIIDKFDGSERAKERLSAILATMAGEKTVLAACDELGICETMFYKMRDKFLSRAVPLLEPEKCGRKAFPKPDPEVEKLNAEVKELKNQLIGAETREQVLRLGIEPREVSNTTSSKKKPGANRRKKKLKKAKKHRR